MARRLFIQFSTSKARSQLQADSSLQRLADVYTPASEIHHDGALAVLLMRK